MEFEQCNVLLLFELGLMLLRTGNSYLLTNLLVVRNTNTRKFRCYSNYDISFEMDAAVANFKGFLVLFLEIRSNMMNISLFELEAGGLVH